MLAESNLCLLSQTCACCIKPVPAESNPCLLRQICASLCAGEYTKDARPGSNRGGMLRFLQAASTGSCEPALLAGDHQLGNAECAEHGSADSLHLGAEAQEPPSQLLPSVFTSTKHTDRQEGQAQKRPLSGMSMWQHQLHGTSSQTCSHLL